MKDKTVHLNLKPSGGDFEFYPEKYSLYHSDCFDVLQHIENNSIDAIIADLPYGTTACKWDSILPLDKLWEQYERIIKYNGAIVLFGSQPFTTDLINSNRKLFKYCWVWNKFKGGNIMTCKYQPYKIHEDIVIFSKAAACFTKNGNAMKYNPIMEMQQKRTGKNYSKSRIVDEKWQVENYEKEYSYKYPKSIINISNANRVGMNHPTQKPLDLINYLVLTYTNEGDMILDNTMGSGTTGVACINTGRKFIGIEKEKQYYDVASYRISRAVGVLNSNAPTLNFEQSTEL